MTNEFQENDQRPLGEFEREMLRFQPAQPDNAEEVFYEAGWQACLANDGKRIETSPQSSRWSSFSRGLLVGLAVSLLSVFFLQSAFRTSSDQDSLAKDSGKTDKNESTKGFDEIEKSQLVQNEDKLDQNSGELAETNALALNRSVKAIVQWMSQISDSQPSINKVSATSEPVMVSQAFRQTWISIESRPGSLISVDLDEPEPLSSRDVDRVLDYF